MSTVNPGTRECPFCKEEIKADAVKCKHCGSRIAATQPEHGGVCPFCKESINPEAILCKHCKSNLRTKECGCSNQSAYSERAQAFSFARPTASSFGGQRAMKCDAGCVGSTLVCVCLVHIPGVGDGLVIYPCGSCIGDPIFTARLAPV